MSGDVMGGVAQISLGGGIISGHGRDGISWLGSINICSGSINLGVAEWYGGMKWRKAEIVWRRQLK